jgi:electron transfer flavoprotein alpha subunit
LIAQEAKDGGYNLLVASHDNLGKEIMPRVAIINGYTLISGVTELANLANGCMVKRNVFSGKAIAEVASKSTISILTVLPNSFGVKKVGGTAAIVAMSATCEPSQVKLVEVKGNHGDAGVPLPEADLVVSAGRGMKGPENWGMVEELASILGAATACSRPVSDIGWRPHHEHVGQTGIAIRPNLYIAIGISGAIQHLAGVNGSKVIVVINKDPEAPFFKAADYGIVGDAFEVLPRLIDAAKHFTANK